MTTLYNQGNIRKIIENRSVIIPIHILEEADIKIKDYVKFSVLHNYNKNKKRIVIELVE